MKELPEVEVFRQMLLSHGHLFRENHLFVEVFAFVAVPVKDMIAEDEFTTDVDLKHSDRQNQFIYSPYNTIQYGNVLWCQNPQETRAQ